MVSIAHTLDYASPRRGALRVSKLNRAARACGYVTVAHLFLFIPAMALAVSGVHGSFGSVPYPLDPASKAAMLVYSTLAFAVVVIAVIALVDLRRSGCPIPVIAIAAGGII